MRIFKANQLNKNTIMKSMKAKSYIAPMSESVCLEQCGMICTSQLKGFENTTTQEYNFKDTYGW